MPLSTPVAFLIFNRPDVTEMTFERIAEAKPEKLFVIADGPRNVTEVESCQRARAVLDRVDWDCEVSRNFSEENLGCGRRVSTGIEWVFSEVEEAIFLEDDTVPSASFFPYCAELLQRYRHDERVMTISGNNFQLGRERSKYSYHFSKYPGCWGWASWRRAWEHYDYEMKSWPEFKRSDLVETLGRGRFEQGFWTSLFDDMYQDPDRIDTWDHQWKYASWSQGGLAIEPRVNLVANVGLEHPKATHAMGGAPHLGSLAVSAELHDLEHPPFVVRHSKADDYIFDTYISDRRARLKGSLFDSVQRPLSVLRGMLPGR
jgi:hypothetical protein